MDPAHSLEPRDQRNLLLHKGNRPLNYLFRSARAMTMRWIWLVPS